MPVFRPALTLFALWLTVFGASSQVLIVSPLLSNIEGALGVPQAQLGKLITVYAAALGVFALLAGPVSDRIGRRRILILGSTLLAGTLWMHGLATSFWSLMLVRGLAGAAGGLLSGAAVSYVGDAFPYEKRGWATGWVMSGIAMGQVLGVPAGKLLADAIDYRFPFLVFAAAATLAALLILRWVPQPAVLRASQRITMKSVWTGYAGLVRDPGTRSAMGAYFLMFWSIGLFVPYFPYWLEREIGLSGIHIATLFLVGGLANMISGPLAGRLSDQVGRKPLVLLSCALFALVMVSTTWVVTGPISAMVFFAVAMVSVGMRMSPFQALVTALVPSTQRGIMMSGAIAFGQLGMAAASALSGWVYFMGGMQGITWVSTGFILLMSAVVHWTLPEPTQDAPTVQAAAAVSSSRG
jgi:predicted MFS family arabinose efflux permease